MDLGIGGEATTRSPTAFTIAPGDVQLLQDAAREALHRLPAFQELRKSLGLPMLSDD